MITDHILDNKLDIVALTETWLTENDQVVINELTPPGYQCHHKPRAGKKMEVWQLFAKSELKNKVKEPEPASLFEHIRLLITAVSKTINLVVLYRIPPSTKNGIKSTQFLTDLQSQLDQWRLESGASL